MTQSQKCMESILVFLLTIFVIIIVNHACIHVCIKWNFLALQSPEKKTHLMRHMCAYSYNLIIRYLLLIGLYQHRKWHDVKYVWPLYFRCLIICIDIVWQPRIRCVGCKVIGFVHLHICHWHKIYQISGVGRCSSKGVHWIELRAQCEKIFHHAHFCQKTMPIFTLTKLLAAVSWQYQ